MSNTININDKVLFKGEMGTYFRFHNALVEKAMENSVYGIFTKAVKKPARPAENASGGDLIKYHESLNKFNALGGRAVGLLMSMLTGDARILVMKLFRDDSMRNDKKARAMLKLLESNYVEENSDALANDIERMIHGFNDSEGATALITKLDQAFDELCLISMIHVKSDIQKKTTLMTKLTQPEYVSLVNVFCTEETVSYGGLCRKLRVVDAMKERAKATKGVVSEVSATSTGRSETGNTNTGINKKKRKQEHRFNTGNGDNNGLCYFCNKPGHKITDCWACQAAQKEYLKSNNNDGQGSTGVTKEEDSKKVRGNNQRGENTSRESNRGNDGRWNKKELKNRVNEFTADMNAYKAAHPDEKTELIPVPSNCYMSDDEEENCVQGRVNQIIAVKTEEFMKFYDDWEEEAEWSSDVEFPEVLDDRVTCSYIKKRVSIDELKEKYTLKSDIEEYITLVDLTGDEDMVNELEARTQIKFKNVNDRVDLTGESDDESEESVEDYHIDDVLRDEYCAGTAECYEYDRVFYNGMNTNEDRYYTVSMINAGVDKYGEPRVGLKEVLWRSYNGGAYQYESDEGVKVLKQKHFGDSNGKDYIAKKLKLKHEYPVKEFDDDVKKCVAPTHYVYKCEEMNRDERKLKEAKLLVNLGIMVDSGANISITSKDIAKYLQLEIKRYVYPVEVRLADNGSMYIYEYVEMGGIIGNAAIMPGATHTIVSVGRLDARGFLVEFGHDQVRIKNGKNEVLVSGGKQSEDELYYISPTYLITLFAYLNLPLGNDNKLNKKVYAAKRRSPIDGEKLRTVVNLHERMRHANPKFMALCIDEGMWNGRTTVKSSDVLEVFEHYDCLACAMGKTNSVPRQLGSGVGTNVIGHTLCIDRVGAITPKSYNGYQYFYLVVCRASGFVSTYLSTTKHDLTDVLNDVILFYKKYGHTVKNIRCDQDSVMMSDPTTMFLDQLSIIVDPSVPDQQNQNPAERHIQTMYKGVSTLLYDQNQLDATFWPLALMAHVEGVNAIPNKLSTEMSPYEAVTGRKPNISKGFSYKFGEVVVMKKTTGERAGTHETTFSVQNELGIVIANGDSRSGGFIVYKPSTKKLVTRSNMHVHAGPTPKLIKANGYSSEVQEGEGLNFQTPNLMEERVEVLRSKELLAVNTSTLQEGDDTVPVKVCEGCSIQAVSNATETDDIEDIIEPMARGMRQRQTKRTQSVMLEDTVQTVTPVHEEVGQRVSARTRRPNSQLEGYVTTSLVVNKLVKDNDQDSPSLNKALRSSDYKEWIKAINTELSQMTSMQVYTAVQRSEVPRERTIYPSMFVLKRKRDTITGEITKYKARLVFLGNHIRAEDVYTDCYAPTASSKALMMMQSISTIMGYVNVGYDVTGAFLYADVKEELYMNLPKGYNFGNTVWLLKKTLYGLPQAPKAFYEHISAHLVKNGYQQCITEQCMFYKDEKDEKIIMVLHVDDLAVAASSGHMIDRLSKVMRSLYDISVTENLTAYTGIHFERNESGDTVCTQPSYIKSMLETYDLEDGNVCDTPMSVSENENGDSSLIESRTYRSLLGALMHVEKTRPDVNFSLSRLASKAKTPTVYDYSRLKRVLRHIKGTASKGITFKRNVDTEGKEKIKLYCYCDASYASNEDYSSQSGYSFCLGKDNGMFYSKSQKQSIIALSSTEAEHMAAYEATKEIVWLRELLKELGFEQKEPTVIFEDNMSTMEIVMNFNTQHKRTKHYPVRCAYLKRKAEEGVIQLRYLKTEDQVADVLTKALVKSQHNKLSNSLLGVDVPDVIDQSKRVSGNQRR